jgi:hypothetical protein
MSSAFAAVHCARALLAGGVEDDVDQRLAGLRVLLLAGCRR